MVDRSDLAGVLEETPGMFGPVVEVGPWAQQTGGAHPGVVGGHADRDRPAGVRAQQDHTARLVQLDEMGDRIAEVVHPALQ